jgi:hypothetical protein
VRGRCDPFVLPIDGSSVRSATPVGSARLRHEQTKSEHIKVSPRLVYALIPSPWTSSNAQRCAVNVQLDK